MSDHVKISDEAGVRTILFARPEKKNALTREMYAAAAAALRQAQDDSAVRVVLFAGEGDAFTAGNDLNDFLEHPPFSEDGASPVEQFMRAVLEARKPVAAAVGGLAVGIGVTMLLHCDLVYASRMATFSTPFVKLALAPEYASTLTMPATMGRAKAMEMLLLGEKLSAEEAERAGLVARVYADAELMERATEKCRKLARLAPGAVEDAKALLAAPAETVEARIEREAKLFNARLDSDEFREAAAAFFERREPDFAKFG